RLRLERGQAWHSAEKLQAVRMLGKQPGDIAEDPQVAAIFFACHVLQPDAGPAFTDVGDELPQAEVKAGTRRLAGGEMEALRPPNATAARGSLREIVDRTTSRLEAIALAHRERTVADGADPAGPMTFDISLEGERLRRYELACGRSLRKTLELVLALRRA